jgi:O-antigen/teichoic acid export membrane protein
VFGSRYDIGADWLRILLVGQIVNVSVGAAGFVLIMVGRTTWDLLVYASSFAVDVIIAVLLVPHLGPKGAAIAQATTLVFSNLFRLSLVWRFVRIQPYDRDYLRLLLPTALGAVTMLGVHSVLEGPRWAVDLLGTGVIGGLVYSTAFVLFGLTPAERGAVKRVLQRGRAPAT